MLKYSTNLLFIAVFQNFSVSLQRKEILFLKILKLDTTMNITILKNKRNKEVINRIDLDELVRMILEGDAADEVKKARSLYHLMRPTRQLSGYVDTGIDTAIKLPYVCFGAEMINRNDKRKLVAYNGLIVLEINGFQHVCVIRYGDQQ